MFSRIRANRKRSRSALSNIANVHQNNKRIKLEPNHQNICRTNGKRTNVEPLSSVINVHQNKRIKLCNESQLKPTGSCLSTQQSSRPLHLNHLPFYCLSCIFDRISLQHRITRLSLVCHHWKSTVDEMCTIKGQLIINLFSSYKPLPFEFTISDPEQYWSNVRHERMESLLLKNLKSILPDLSLRFPLVTQLVIRSNDTTHQQNRASLKLFLSLLSQQALCSSLTSLTLYKLTKITDPTYLPQLCSAINRKSSNLTHLNLYLQDYGPVTHQISHPEPVNLHNVLPQLERFIVLCGFANWVSTVRTLGAVRTSRTNIVKELDLSEDKLLPENLSRLLSLTGFTSTVTHLHLTAILSREWFSLICESFSLLQFLQINVGNNNFNADWFTDLRKLNHLTELKMHRFQLDPTIVPKAISTIKKLTICDYELLTKFRLATNSNRFNASHYCHLLSHHFPSVSVLILFSNEKRVKMVDKNIRKWAQVHFKQIEKVVLVLNAEEYRNDRKWRKKFMREYLKLSQN